MSNKLNENIAHTVIQVEDVFHDPAYGHELFLDLRQIPFRVLILSNLIHHSLHQQGRRRYRRLELMGGSPQENFLPLILLFQQMILIFQLPVTVPQLPGTSFCSIVISTGKSSGSTSLSANSGQNIPAQTSSSDPPV